MLFLLFVVWVDDQFGIWVLFISRGEGFGFVGLGGGGGWENVFGFWRDLFKGAFICREDGFSFWAGLVQYSFRLSVVGTVSRGFVLRVRFWNVLVFFLNLVGFEFGFSFNIRCWVKLSSVCFFFKFFWRFFFFQKGLNQMFRGVVLTGSQFFSLIYVLETVRRGVSGRKREAGLSERIWYRLEWGVVVYRF